MTVESLQKDENLMEGLERLDGKVWRHFLKGERGWRALVRSLRGQESFGLDEGRIEDAVQIALKKVANRVAKGEFVCSPNGGLSSLWKYVAMAAKNSAKDLLKKERRSKMRTDLEEDVVENADRVFSFDRWKVEASIAELDNRRRMQFYVLYQALGLVLDDEKVPADRRRVLYALMVEGMTPGEIRELDPFKAKSEAAFYKYVKDSKDVLRRMALRLWRMSMPKGETEADREYMKTWKELAADLSRCDLSRQLKTRVEKAG